MLKPHYTPEFRAEAIKQVTERGYSVLEVSERIGVTRSTLYNWLKQHRQATNPDPVISAQADLATENAQLKAALKRAEEERDILKKAAAYFAKQFS
ncbi:MAG: transposase [Pseudomonadaceae bacterium]|nr:transposase [Pseudomonadaceae bacterium]